MPDWSADRDRVIAFYETQLARYGPRDPRSLHWVGAGTQMARFHMLYQVGPWAGRSVADVGSGLGDFCAFLVSKGHAIVAPGDGAAPAGAVRYIGYDVTPEMVTFAQANFPHTRFAVRDCVTDGLAAPTDYVVASGTFNVRVDHHRDFFRAAIDAMYRDCLQAVAFNFLGPPAHSGWESPLYYEAEPLDMAAYGRTLTPHVALREGYLAGDATVFLYKDAALCPDCRGVPSMGQPVHG